MAWTQELIANEFDGIMNDMLTGTLAAALDLRAIPAQSFFKHLTLYHENAERYARLREFKGDLLADQIIPIADSDENPLKVRNQIDARRWLASKYYPKTYGDKLDLTVSQTVDIRGALSEAKQRTVEAIVLPRVSLPTSGTEITDATGMSASKAGDIIEND